MRIFSTLSPKSPDDRRILTCLVFFGVAEVIVFWLQTHVLFSDVRVNVVFDLFQIFSLTLISLAFCLHSNRKERLTALCITIAIFSLTETFCSGKIHAKIWRFQHPGNYNPVVLEEKTVKGKTIRAYRIRDQKYPAILVARVEPINEQVALYWPLVKLGDADHTKLRVSDDSTMVTIQSGQGIIVRVIRP